MGTASLCHTNTTHPITNIIKQFPKPFRIGHFHQLRIPLSVHKGLQQRHGLSSVNVVAVGCMTWESSGLLAEMKPQEEEEGEEEELEEWMRERCKEKKGMVEVLEWLENEAIMGEDHGREAIDYNRRAQIFDKSSRVFQALKSQQS